MVLARQGGLLPSVRGSRLQVAFRDARARFEVGSLVRWAVLDFPTNPVGCCYRARC